MIIYTNLYKTSTRNYNVISDHFGLEHIEPLSYEDFCLCITPGVYTTINGMRGRHHTEEAKKLISQANRGRKITEEQRKNLSKAMLALPTARCKNQSGDLNPMFGKKHSDETKKKISEKAKARPADSHPCLGITWNRTAESNAKFSEFNKGKKRFYKPDGSWTWIYPTKT